VLIGHADTHRELELAFGAGRLRTPVLEQRLRASVAPVAPGMLRVTGLQSSDVFLTGFGDLYRVLLHSPRLKLVTPFPLMTYSPSDVSGPLAHAHNGAR
jgi:hypothetical protein